MKLDELLDEGLFGSKKKEPVARTFPAKSSTAFINDTRKDTGLEDEGAAALRVKQAAAKNAKKANHSSQDWTFS